MTEPLPSPVTTGDVLAVAALHRLDRIAELLGDIRDRLPAPGGQLPLSEPDGPPAASQPPTPPPSAEGTVTLTEPAVPSRTPPRRSTKATGRRATAT